MRREGVPPDLVSFNALLGACAVAGDVRRALETLRQLRASGHTPDVVTFTSLIKAYGKAGLVEGSEAVFEAMQFPRTAASRTGAQPGGTGMPPAGEGTDAHVAAARAVADGQPAVRPNEFTYAELMRAQLRAGCPRRVGELLALAEAANAGRPLKTRTLNLGVRAHCAQGALRPALRLVVRMRGLGVRTDAHARHALAALCAARGQYALASRLAAGEVA
ncbi:hypothetical protein T492DRAFT_847446 [Pavlovales sp. CCMP2436]|nr:hypothetical protein T492DRAFT_847446 [Pavlovales sp. CCMP2436]